MILYLIIGIISIILGIPLIFYPERSAEYVYDLLRNKRLVLRSRSFFGSGSYYAKFFKIYYRIGGFILVYVGIEFLTYVFYL
jgi:hypothetical protein